MDRLKISSVLNVQHLHDWTVDTVDRKIFHAPGNAVRVLYDGQTSFIATLLDDPLTGPTGFHRDYGLLVVLLDGEGLKMTSQTLAHAYDPRAHVGLFRRLENRLAFDGMGFPFRFLHCVDAVVVVDIRLQTSDPEHIRSEERRVGKERR